MTSDAVTPYRPVVVAPIAKFAVADAASAYEASRPGYAARFIECFAQVTQRIERFPESSPVIAPGIRRALFPGPFPFCVLYRIDELRIVIADVLPTVADPQRWSRSAE